jgi:hypothetical protein
MIYRNYGQKTAAESQASGAYQDKDSKTILKHIEDQDIRLLASKAEFDTSRVSTDQMGVVQNDLDSVCLGGGFIPCKRLYSHYSWSVHTREVLVRVRGMIRRQVDRLSVIAQCEL